MKALLLPTKTCSEMLRVLREHFINEGTSVFMMNISNAARVDITQSTEIQAQVQLQICKILLDNLYRYINENRLSEFIRHTMHNHVGLSVYINPVYVTEILKPYYDLNVPAEDHQEIENNLLSIHYSYINLIYMRDHERFNRIMHETMMLMMEMIPSNVQVIRFELTPSLAPMVCYTEKPDQFWSKPESYVAPGMMHPSFA